MRGLLLLFPQQIHLTCLSHGIHRTAEAVRVAFPKADKFISCVKKIYKKSPKRINLFRTSHPEVPLPPSPIVTRWGSWLSASFYFAKYHGAIAESVMELNEADSDAIKQAKRLLEDKSLQSDFAFISTHFAVIPPAIEALEARGKPLIRSLKTVEGLRTSLAEVPGPIGGEVSRKLETILSKNPGYGAVKSIGDALEGKSPRTEFPPQFIGEFSHAPLTSAEVERTFSTLKNILTDRRMNLTNEHLKWYLVLSATCNDD